MYNCLKCGARHHPSLAPHNIEYCSGVMTGYDFSIIVYRYRECYRKNRLPYIDKDGNTGKVDYTEKPIPLDEHLHITCRVCGYEWIEETADHEKS